MLSFSSRGRSNVFGVLFAFKGKKRGGEKKEGENVWNMKRNTTFQTHNRSLPIRVKINV
jgi:hypothetical protein